MAKAATPRNIILAGAIAAATGAAALIAPWEGLRRDPYRDVVGVWTVCYGHTSNVQQRHYSKAECDALLKDETVRHLTGVAKCINVPLKENEWYAVGSLTYNFGWGAICNSTLVRKINAGYPSSEWCKHLFDWDKVKDRWDPVRKKWTYKVLPGLQNRRRAEYKVCIG